MFLAQQLFLYGSISTFLIQIHINCKALLLVFFNMFSCLSEESTQIWLICFLSPFTTLHCQIYLFSIFYLFIYRLSAWFSISCITSLLLSILILSLGSCKRVVTAETLPRIYIVLAGNGTQVDGLAACSVPVLVHATSYIDVHSSGNEKSIHAGPNLEVGTKTQ